MYRKITEMKSINISALRAKMKYYFDLVSNIMDVIMSIKKYNALKETEYLLSTHANRKRLAESIQQMQAGETIRYTID